MKRTIKTIALILSLLLIAQSGLSIQAQAYGSELYEYLDSIGSYDYKPLEDGYYGYLAIEYPNEDDSDFETASLPVLVKDGHTLADAKYFSDLFGLTCTGAGTKQTTLSVYNKSVTFREKKTQVKLTQGRLSYEYTIDIAPVNQDDRTWIPLQYACVLLNMDLLLLREDRITIGRPREDILDVAAATESIGIVDLVQIYDASVWAELGLDTGSRIVDNMDGILHFELDKLWDASGVFNPIAIAAEYVNGRLTDKTYAQDVTKAVLARMDAELKPLDTAQYLTYDATMKLLSAYGGTAAMYSEASAELLKLVEAAPAGHYLGGAAAENVVGMVCGASELAKTVLEKLDYLDAASQLATSVIRSVYFFADLQNQETLVNDGLQLVLDRSEEGYMSNNTRKGINTVLEAYDGDILSAEKLMLSDSLSGYLDALASIAMGPASAFLAVYQVGAAVNSDWAAGLQASESYQKYLVAVTMQTDTRAVLLDNLTKLYSGDPVQGELLDETAQLLYTYLKLTYVTRSLGVAAMSKQAGTATYTRQLDAMEREARLLALTMQYTAESYRDPSEIRELFQAGLPDDFLEYYVTPCYVHFFLSVKDAGTREPVPHAQVEMDFDGHTNIPLSSGDTGSFEFYLPISWEDAYAATVNPDPSESLSSVHAVCSHEDYPDPVEQDFGDYRLVTLPDRPARELQLELEIVMGEMDYWTYIHDLLLPEYGYASLENTNVSFDACGGILGAQVLDMNRDKIEDMILFRFESTYTVTVVMDLYTMVNGKITLVNTTTVCGSAGMWYHDARIGIMELDGLPYLYVHEITASGVGDAYTFYRYGKDGLETAVSIRFKPGAGPRNDYFCWELNDFNGITGSDGYESLIWGSALEDAISNFGYNKLLELGFPEPGRRLYSEPEGYKNLMLAEYWDTPFCEKLLLINLEKRSNNLFSMLEDHTPLLEHMAEFDDFNPENPRENH